MATTKTQTTVNCIDSVQQYPNNACAFEEHILWENQKEKY